MHSLAPTCQVLRLTVPILHSQKLHLIYSQLQGQNGHFAVKSQTFCQHLILSPQSSFDQVLIMIPQE